MMSVRNQADGDRILAVGYGIPTMFTAGPIGPADIRRMLRTAEEGGLATIAVGDHLNWYSGTLEAVTVLGFLAAETDLHLQANVIVLPLRNPYLIAKGAATIATLAAGGFSLGVGVGGEHEAEYQALGVEAGNRGSRMDEALPIVASLLRGEAVDVDGEYYHCRAAPLDPPASVPVLIGGRGPAALRRAAEVGDGWSSAWVRPDQFRRRADRIRQGLRIAGRSADDFRFVAHARIAFGRDASDAWAHASEYLSLHYGTEAVEAFRRHTICGEPSKVANALNDYRDAGAEEVIVTFASDDHARDLQRFCDEVMPLID